VNFTIEASDSERVRRLFANGKSTGIFLTEEEVDALFINTFKVKRARLERIFADSPNRLAMLRKFAV
jgi:predicted membrane-bound mannosyltransferase